VQEERKKERGKEIKLKKEKEKHLKEELEKLKQKEYEEKMKRVQKMRNSMSKVSNNPPSLVDASNINKMTLPKHSSKRKSGVIKKMDICEINTPRRKDMEKEKGGGI
jgi:hypothetical protein